MLRLCLSVQASPVTSTVSQAPSWTKQPERPERRTLPPLNWDGSVGVRVDQLVPRASPLPSGRPSQRRQPRRDGLPAQTPGNPVESVLALDTA